jgi:hypothetical protein
MKTLQEQLDDAYVAIGEAPFPIPEELFDEVDRILDLMKPRHLTKEELEPKDQQYCSPHCNGHDCWDCAAIRGGCPEDA